MKNFAGMYTALLTPFREDGSINENALSDIIEHNLRLGIDGFYCCGSTAEVFMLTDGERRGLMQLCADIIGDRALKIAHVGAVSADIASDLAVYAEKLGYDAVSAVAPFYYSFSLEEIIGYYRQIANASELKMLVYNLPAATKISLGLSELEGLFESDRFLGVKHTSGDFFALEGIKSHFPDKYIFNGYDEMLLSGLAAGADGGIGSTYNFAADKVVKIRELFLAGRLDEAKAIQHEENEIVRSLCKVGVMPGEKAVLELLGIDAGYCRRPMKRCSSEDYRLLEKEVLPLLTAVEK